MRGCRPLSLIAGLGRPPCPGNSAVDATIGAVSDTGAGLNELAPEHVRAERAAVFDRAADIYDRLGIEFFGSVGEWLVDAAAVEPGHRVLDVGSGRGAATFPAANAVGSTGSVVAVDLAPRMIELLQADVSALGITNITAYVADAQELEIEGPFDRILAAFVLFFMTDPGAAVRRFHALLTPGGRIAISSFAAEDGRWQWTRDLAEMVPAEVRPPNLTSQGPFSSTDALHALLTSNGFTAARSIEREVTLRFDDADHWLQWSMSQGQRSIWERLPADRVASAQGFARARINEIALPDGGVELCRGVRITTAERSPGLSQPRSSSAT